MSVTQPNNNSDKPAPREQTRDIGYEIKNLVDHIDALAETLPRAVEVIEKTYSSSRSELTKFFQDECSVAKKIGDDVSYTIAPGQSLKWQRLQRNVRRAALSRVLVPRGFLVALVSQFDAYVGALIKQLFKLKPDIVSSSSRNLTFEELSGFTSIDEAREFIIEKGVETVLRCSHAEQFTWLEKTIGVKLGTDLPVWSTFIEVTERRNLFVHNDGMISRQYLEVCSKHGYKTGGARIGKYLPITKEYFELARRCLFEIGVKLGIVMWRKILPLNTEEADGTLVTVTYDLMDKGRYPLAQVLLDFGAGFKKYSSADARLRLVVNRAQSYKWMGDEAKCKAILDAEDWSVLSLTFRLAHAVLKDDFEAAKVYRGPNRVEAR